ncbi:coiled-coil domain-containing protein [Citrobacter freundii]|uniref:hypothetical protein n=2 Tax=Citrobacter TaxID=544 RepID=UPI002293C2A6|nr:hypothetical protein [Citrobacter freundii]HCW3403744.1 hypothetical protein [Citrobacter freundii]
MTALNKQALRYGDNVLWFLNELAAYDASDIDGGEFDVYGEDRNGLEGCSTIDVTELAADAAKLIEAAEKRIAELEARTPYGYLRQCDGQIQISIGSEQPHNRSGGYATPWFAIYTAAGIGVKGE